MLNLQCDLPCDEVEDFPNVSFDAVACDQTDSATREWHTCKPKDSLTFDWFGDAAKMVKKTHTSTK